MREMNQEKKKGQIIPFMQDGAYFYKKGIQAYQNRQVDQAVHYIQRAVRLDPEEPVFLCQLAIVLAEKGEFEKANDWLEKVINEVDETMSECYFFMANNLAHLGHFELAKLRLKKYLKMEPDGEFAEDAQSLLYMIEEEGGELEDELDELDPVPTPLEKIADYLNKGNYEWAEKEARGYILEHSKEWDVYAYLAESLMNQGKTEEARSILKDLLIKEDPNFLAQCLMAVLIKKNGEQESQIWINNLKYLRPMKDWHTYYLAKTMFFVGEYEVSYKLFQRLYRGSDFRKTPAFFHQLGIAAWKNGHKEKAQRHFEKARALDFHDDSIAAVYLDLLSSAAEKGTYPENEWFIYSEPERILESIE